MNEAHQRVRQFGVVYSFEGRAGVSTTALPFLRGPFLVSHTVSNISNNAPLLVAFVPRRLPPLRYSRRNLGTRDATAGTRAGRGGYMESESRARQVQLWRSINSYSKPCTISHRSPAEIAHVSAAADVEPRVDGEGRGNDRKAGVAWPRSKATRNQGSPGSRSARNPMVTLSGFDCNSLSFAVATINSSRPFLLPVARV